MSLLTVCIIFYLIGSFPTAYLLLKIKYNKNLTEEGSGNIGARNTFDVTNSKLDGIIVLIIDFLKGMIPALWFIYYSGFDIHQILLPSVSLLAGHNFSVWLKFKGGRGLATGAGIMAVINFSLIIIWLILCFVFYKFSRNIHIANTVSLILLPIVPFFFSSSIAVFGNNYLINGKEDSGFLFLFCSAVCFVILLKHISPLIELIKNKKSKVL